MIYFEQAVIQERISQFFINSIENERLAHAYVFYGHEGCGKEAFAFELAKLLNCDAGEKRPCNECPPCSKINKLNHPDVKFIFPVSAQTKTEQIAEIIRGKAKNPYIGIPVSGHKNIAIEVIRELKNEAKYAPFEADKRLFIISGAEYFSREASNSFLKLLEEPPENLLIILITNDLNRLLETIRSRCQPVYFPPFSDAEIAEIMNRYVEEPDNLGQLIPIARRNIKKIFELLHADSEKIREQVYHFLQGAASGNMLKVSETLEEISQRRDKNYIIDFLNLIILWFRDAVHYLVLGSTEDFVNLDYQEQIQKFAEFYSATDMGKLVSFVEKAIKSIHQNAHPVLTLTNLAIKINDNLIKGTPVKEAV